MEETHMVNVTTEHDVLRRDTHGFGKFYCDVLKQHFLLSVKHTGYR